MNFKSIAVCLVIFLLAAAAISAQSTASELNIPALIKECSDDQRRMDKRVFEYWFTTKETSYGLNGRGEQTKEITQLFEKYPRNQGSAKIALSKNGKTVSEKDIEKQREKAGKQLEKDEWERSEREVNAPERESGISFSKATKRKFILRFITFFAPCIGFLYRGKIREAV